MLETHGVGVPNQDAPGVAFAEQPELVPEKAATLGRHFIAMLETHGVVLGRQPLPATSGAMAF